MILIREKSGPHNERVAVSPVRCSPRYNIEEVLKENTAKLIVFPTVMQHVYILLFSMTAMHGHVRIKIVEREIANLSLLSRLATCL